MNMPTYELFAEYLEQQRHESSVTCSFKKIEEIIGGLPPSAKKYHAWWSNDPSRPLMRRVLDKGWIRSELNFKEQIVVFKNRIGKGSHNNCLTAVTGDKVLKCQKRLESILRSRGESKQVHLAFPSGKTDLDVIWFKESGLWWGSSKENNYFCNSFGIADDEEALQKNRLPICEINIPHSTHKSNTQGLFAKDDTGRYYITRTDRFSVSRNRTTTLSGFKCPKVHICNENRSVLQISVINDENLVANLNQFVRNVREKRERIINPLPENSAPKPYSIKDIIDDGCFLEESGIESMLDTLEKKKNIILQGPPGTGKTWLARRLGFALVGNKSDSAAVRAVQFHPNFSYEDFVKGWRPGGSKDGRLTLVDGPFLKMIEYARNKPGKFVMVIEEINRGNPANIFGEMLTLLEADKRKPEEALMLSYTQDNDDLGYVPDELVHIPDNLYVIGTMNVADRSIALVDLALRRRFGFCYLEPVFEKDTHVHLWKDWVNEHCGIPEDTLGKIADNLKSLNKTISGDELLGPHFMIGHSYVTPDKGCKIDDPKEWFKNIVDYEIRPLLEEYWITDRKKADDEAEKLKRL